MNALPFPLVFFLLFVLALATLNVSAAERLDKDRIVQVAAWLPEQPSAPGRSIADRAFWETLTGQPV